MKVLVITGSAHKNGTSAYLADRFIEGAKEAGHEIMRFDASFKKIHPCMGCDKCRRDGKCAFQDDMNELNPMLLSADAVVFVSPIYYYGMNAQIRATIERFYANDDKIHVSKKTALMITMADDTMESAEGAIASFRGMSNFLGWNISGMVIGKDCATLEMLKKTDFPRQAYELGKNI